MTVQAKSIEKNEKAKRLAWPITWISVALVTISIVISVIAFNAGGEGIEPPLHQSRAVRVIL
jgi:hypothetical protein